MRQRGAISVYVMRRAALSSFFLFYLLYGKNNSLSRLLIHSTAQQRSTAKILI